jgi:hypothetical protein
VISVNGSRAFDRDCYRRDQLGKSTPMDVMCHNDVMKTSVAAITVVPRV